MHITRWTFVIQQDASRFRAWRDVEPHVKNGFPKLFATETLAVKIRTDAHPVKGPTCTIVVEMPMRYDDQQKAEVKRAIGESFVPFVFGPRATLQDMQSTLVFKCDPADLRAAPSPMGA